MNREATKHADTEASIITNIWSLTLISAPPLARCELILRDTDEAVLPQNLNLSFDTIYDMAPEEPPVQEIYPDSIVKPRKAKSTKSKPDVSSSSDSDAKPAADAKNKDSTLRSTSGSLQSSKVSKPTAGKLTMEDNKSEFPFSDTLIRFCDELE